LNCIASTVIVAIVVSLVLVVIIGVAAYFVKRRKTAG